MRLISPCPAFFNLLRRMALGALCAFTVFIATQAAASHPEQRPAKVAFFTVNPKCWCQDTGIKVVKGQTYRLTATGRTVDWFIPCDASGPRCCLARLVSSLCKPGLRVKPSRVRKAHFLTLIGALECAGDGRCPKDAFVIGTGRDWTPDASGTLHVFVNDWPSKYHNNKGCLHLRVEQVR